MRDNIGTKVSPLYARQAGHQTEWAISDSIFTCLPFGKIMRRFKHLSYKTQTADTEIKHASLLGAINKWFGTLDELNLRSGWGYASIEAMPNLCPRYLALQSKFPKQNFVCCQLKFQETLALAKHKHESWKCQI
jgi:hypothetical protein